MRILTKITGNKELYNKVFLDLLKINGISCFKIQGEKYELLTPFQSAVLQKVGVGLEFYESNRELYREFPFVPEGTKVTKIEGIIPEPEDKEEFEKFMSKLEKKLAHTH